MAAKKRKTIRSTTRKAVKKPAARMLKKATATKGMGRKAKTTISKKSTATVKPARLAPPITSVDKPFTKGQLIGALAGRTGLPRKEVSTLYDELISIIAAHLKRQGPGQCTLPSLVKMKVVNKPATKARQGTNPFTGEKMMFKAKPARNIVKVRALKALKAMV